MGEGYNKLFKWLAEGAIDVELGLGECGKGCTAGDCDDCGRQVALDTTADQVCEELLTLGKKLTKEWLEAQGDVT